MQLHLEAYRDSLTQKRLGKHENLGGDLIGTTAIWPRYRILSNQRATVHLWIINATNLELQVQSINPWIFKKPKLFSSSFAQWTWSQVSYSHWLLFLPCRRLSVLPNKVLFTGINNSALQISSSIGKNV